jgi:N utilization substance protein B
MARVDRNLLRLGAWELLRADDVPPKAAINEAIEIAKRFGTAESPAFVNGILDRCLDELGRREPRAPGKPDAKKDADGGAPGDDAEGTKKDAGGS